MVHGPRHSLDLVGQSTVDVFIAHTLLLSGEGPGGGVTGWAEPEAWGYSGEGGSQEGERGGPDQPETVASVVTHMIPLFWAIGVQDRADRV